MLGLQPTSTGSERCCHSRTNEGLASYIFLEDFARSRSYGSAEEAMPTDVMRESGQDQGADGQNSVQECHNTPTAELPPASWEDLRCYYSDNIARLMVWVDTDRNLYQNRIVLMASETPVPRLAIFAVAALHRNATCPSGNVFPPESARDDAVMGITASVESILDHSAPLTLERAQWMLASMLVLSCCEMIKAGAGVAD